MRDRPSNYLSLSLPIFTTFLYQFNDFGLSRNSHWSEKLCHYFLLYIPSSNRLCLFCRFHADAELKVTPVTEPVVHGEGPHWDAETGVLFFVDIDQQRVNRYDPSTNKVTHAQFGESARTANLISFLLCSVCELIVASAEKSMYSANQIWFKVQAVPVFRFDRRKMSSCILWDKCTDHCSIHRLTDGTEFSAPHACSPLSQKDLWYSFLSETELNPSR
jgi:hypothetical protein